MIETTEIGMTVKRGPGRPAAPKIEEKLEHWAYRLELAAAMKAGVMDSESRHLEVANNIKNIILAIAQEMRENAR